VVAIDFLVNKKDIRDVQVGERALAPLAKGHVRLAISRVALTANNVTYAASGDALRYWQFFPSASQPGSHGLVPVWGLAEIVESAVDGLPIGEHVYGFWPMASHLDVLPDRITGSGFVDAAEHRADLPEIYNAYVRMTGPMAALDADMRARLALLFPLYITSFLLDDFLQESAWFEADELVLTSASSKTAIGLAKLTAKRKTRPQVVGLTSPANKEFVQSLGCYDKVVLYDDIDRELGANSAMIVDLAGNTQVRGALHLRYSDKLLYSCAVGTSHWDQFRPTEPVPAGPKPVFFFAPAQAKKRRKEWGGEKLRQVMFERWHELALDSKSWLQVRSVSGAADVIGAWSEVAQGQVSPAQGIMLKLGAG